MEDLVDFVMDTNDLTRTWDRDDITSWLYWANDKRFLLTVSDGSDVIGCMVARPVRQIPVEDKSDEYNENGQYLWIDLAIAPTRDIQKVLYILGKHRFPRVILTASQRLNGPVKVHSVFKLDRAFIREG